MTYTLLQPRSLRHAFYLTPTRAVTSSRSPQEALGAQGFFPPLSTRLLPSLVTPVQVRGHPVVESERDACEYRW